MNNANGEAFEALRAADPAGDLRAETPSPRPNPWTEPMTGQPTPVIQDQRPPHAVGRRRVLALAGAPLALVAAAAVAFVAAQDRTDPTAPPSTAVGDFTPESVVACSEAMVVGDVVSVAASGQDRVLVEMKIDEWVKPSSGAATARFDLVDPTANGGDGVNDPFKAGERIFLRVPQDRTEVVTGQTGDYLTVLADQYREAAKNPDAARPCPR